MAEVTANPLDTAHLSTGIGRRTIRSGKITMAAQATRFALQVASTAVLARLVDPAEFGLVAMAYAVTRFGETFKEAGLSQATIQSEQVSHDQVSTLFWANALLGLGLATVVASTAPLMAWFFNQPELLLVLVVLGTNFIWSGLSVQHSAILRRQMRYGAVAVRDILALAAGFLVGILSALAGLGYWSLVAMACTTAATNYAVSWRLSGWNPGRPKRGSGVRGMLSFGGFLTAANVATYLRRNLDNVLIGWLFGPTILGFYSKAYQLLMLPIQQANRPLSGIILSALSRVQSQPDEFRRIYRGGVFLVTAISMPIAGFAVAAADDIVLLVLGDAWIESTRYFYCLAPAVFAGSLNGVSGWPLISLGLGRANLANQLLATAVIVPSLLVGTFWGATGVALAFSISYCCVIPTIICRSLKGSPLSIGDVLRGVRWPIIATALGLLATLAARSICENHLDVAARFAVSAGVFGLSYLLVICATPEWRAFRNRGGDTTSPEATA